MGEIKFEYIMGEELFLTKLSKLDDTWRQVKISFDSLELSQLKDADDRKVFLECKETLEMFPSLMTVIGVEIKELKSGALVIKESQRLLKQSSSLVNRIWQCVDSNHRLKVKDVRIGCLKVQELNKIFTNELSSSLEFMEGVLSLCKASVDILLSKH